MKKTVIFAIVFAVFSAVCMFIFFSGLETQTQQMAEPITVVVATQKISQGSLIGKNVLTERKIPKEYVQPKYFSSISSILRKDGKANYIALNAIEPGEQILATKISQINENTGVSSIVPEGKKALVIDFETQGQTQVIAPGARIDIMAILPFTENKKTYKGIFTIAQNILVLAVGDKYLGSVQKDNEEKSNGKALTLAVSVEEAQQIMLAQMSGQLRCVIRAIGDNEIYDEKQINSSQLTKKLPQNISKEQASNLTQKDTLNLLQKYMKNN